MFFLVGVVINQFSTIPDENNAVLTLMCVTVIGQEDPRLVASTIDGEASPMKMLSLFQEKTILLATITFNRFDSSLNEL